MAITANRYATNDTDMRETNINVDDINTKIGTVSTADTVLKELRDIKTNTGAVTSNFTVTNSTNVDLMKINIDNMDTSLNNIETSTDNIDDKLGTVSTADTILAELRGIKTNTSGGGGIPTGFIITKEITRPANTTAYAINDIVNDDAVTVLPTLDFGIGNANKRVQISSAYILSNNGSVATKLNPYLQLFNANSLTGSTLTDNSAFNPSYAEIRDKRATNFDSGFTMQTHGNQAYALYQGEMVRIAQLDGTGKLYFALTTLNAYVPISLEKISVTVKGYYLS